MGGGSAGFDPFAGDGVDGGGGDADAGGHCVHSAPVEDGADCGYVLRGGEAAFDGEAD